MGLNSSLVVMLCMRRRMGKKSRGRWEKTAAMHSLAKPPAEAAALPED
jgi:hypothetical protein